MKRNEKINESKFRAEVSQLPDLYMEVLLLYFLSDLTKKAVAKQLNLSYGITRNRLSKGIYLLKKISVKELPEASISFLNSPEKIQNAS
ncbi:MAG TPA: sigma factor-like helix-turn-helix DNA-binding protein [Ferruginibacter sp.]|nr:sigma factor-like helix-turn-helix DNA-binding protein [Ferruginibacter sp.]